MVARFFAVGGVPDFDAAVGAGGGGTFAVGAQGDGVNRFRMALEGDDLFDGGQVPEFR